jgi:hypothetical protein
LFIGINFEQQPDENLFSLRSSEAMEKDKQFTPVDCRVLKAIISR